MVSATTFAVGSALIDNHNAKVDRLNQTIADLQDQVRRLTLMNAIEQATVAGLTSQLEFFASSHPTSPMLKALPSRFEDGTHMNGADIVFQSAFDRKAASLGITNPARYRRR